MTTRAAALVPRVSKQTARLLASKALAAGDRAIAPRGGAEAERRGLGAALPSTHTRGLSGVVHAAVAQHLEVVRGDEELLVRLAAGFTLGAARGLSGTIKRCR